jgi:hypothetical protein
MDEPKEVKIEGDGRDIFVVVDDVRIAKRGHPGTPEAGHVGVAQTRVDRDEQ